MVVEHGSTQMPVKPVVPPPPPPTEPNYSDDEFLDEEQGDDGNESDAGTTEEEEVEEEEESHVINDGKTCSNACECGPGASGNAQEVSPRKRLAMKPRTNVDKIRETIPYPCEAVPKTHLPSWPELPLYTKLPMVPAPPGAIIFSRGPVAKTLLRQNKGFTLTDPWHMRRVPATEYNALHDEHADAYLQKPNVKKLLQQQGLIDDNNDVICSQKEFNRFRLYLGTLHTDQLSAMIADGDQRWLNERHQLLQLLKFQSMSEGRDHDRWLKVQNAAKKNQMKYANMVNKIEQKKANEALRECKYRQEKQRQYIQRRLVGLERDRIVAERRRRQMALDMKRRKELICNISVRDAAAEERVQAEKCIFKRAYNQFLLEWLDAKYQYQADEKQKKKDLEDAVENSMKSKAAKRQERIEKYREMLPDLIEERKAKEERVWNIVRRLFYKWLRKVRERKARKPDALHQSLWDGPTVMEDTLKYLRKESGYEKFDDFILNILRLKEEIKIKLAEEEAEEERERQRLSQLNEGEEEEEAPEGQAKKSSKTAPKAPEPPEVPEPPEESLPPQAGSTIQEEPPEESLPAAEPQSQPTAPEITEE